MTAALVLDEVRVGTPAGGLRPLVGSYLGYRESRPAHPGGVPAGTASPLVRHEAAGAFVVLILGWGAPLDVLNPRSAAHSAYQVDSFVAGPYDGYCTTSTVGAGAGVQLLLTPLAARRILGVPLGELANRAVAVDGLPDPWLDRLRVRLAEMSDWPRRFALLDAALGARLAATDPVEEHLGRAWGRLAGSAGRIGIGELADELGWSRRHLTARFRRELGLGPKTTARLLRFQRAYAALGRTHAMPASPVGSDRPDPTDGWAELAVRWGYYDQSHLIREFREFTGATPTAVGRPGSHSSNPG
ncbi:helix-turn-helix domain-containing protein [Micromonospora sp. NPDC048894]|uniref:helix-turn-helix domain-containing protein n=1 Tax=Micromonospora sp. NPDC048894 TaxID=3155493 RepID=UPI0033DC43E0